MTQDKTKTTPLQNAIIVSSIVGSIMSSYDVTIPEERKKPINEIRRRIKKFMYRRSRSNKKEFLESIKIADSIWRDTVNYFAEKHLKIDAVFTILGLYNKYADEMSKYANVREKQMERYSYDANSGEVEFTSYEVSDYMLEKLSKITGKQNKKLNLLKG